MFKLVYIYYTQNHSLAKPSDNFSEYNWTSPVYISARPVVTLLIYQTVSGW